MLLSSKNAESNGNKTFEVYSSYGQVHLRCDISVKNFVCRMHVFMYFLKQCTLYFMENRVSFVEINV